MQAFLKLVDKNVWDGNVLRSPWPNGNKVRLPCVIGTTVDSMPSLWMCPLKSSITSLIVRFQGMLGLFSRLPVENKFMEDIIME